MVKDARYMTVGEAAAELGISKDMVRKLADGEPERPGHPAVSPVLGSYRINPGNPQSARRILREDVAQLKARQEAQARQQKPPAAA